MTRGELLASLVSHDDLSQLIVRLHGERVQARLMALAMSAPWSMDAEVHYWFRPGRYADGVQVELQKIHGGSIYG
jgi:hypothetical protein